MAEQRYLAVLAVIADGHEVGSVAQQWGVSRQTLHTWLSRYETAGLEGLSDRSHRPGSCPHQMPPLVEAAVLELRRVHPAWGPRRIVVELARRGVAPLPNESGVYRALRRALHPLRQTRPTRSAGPHPTTPSPCRLPRNRGPVTSLLVGLSLAGMSPAMTVEGGTTAAVFATYLEKVLAPALRPGQLVVVDNVGAHKPERMHQLVHAVGCELVFLPAYSPDPSPVEEAFSKIKTRIKAAGARTRTALDATIAAALETVTPADAAGWFTHAGYFSPQPT